MKQNTKKGTYITIRIHKRYMFKIKQKHTKHTTIHKMIQNRPKRIWKNVKNETYKKAANHVWSKYLLIMTDTLLLWPSLHFTPLFNTSLLPLLNFTQIHLTTLSFGLTPFKFPTTPFHITSLNFTSHYCTLRWFLPHFYSFHFTWFINAFLTLPKNLGYKGKFLTLLQVVGLSF